MNIALAHLRKKFGHQQIIDDVSLEVKGGEMFFLLGPSGCGKTTLLRMIAGFFSPDSGTIHFGGRPVNDVPAQHRNTALVFQNYAIWPHLTVFENVAYGLRVRRVPEVELRTRVNEALAQVQMEPLAERKPASLSGGQQQRVALARSIVVKPDLLLFDEPLSNLDAKLRHELRAEIMTLQSRHRMTSIYVTHDQEEALALADRIAVMNGGKVEQIGSPREIYEQPVNTFVAAFIGEINLFEPNSPYQTTLGLTPGERFGFRPENVILAPEGIEARVFSSTYLGSKVALELHLPHSGHIVKAWSAVPISPGERVHFQVPPDKIIRWP